MLFVFLAKTLHGTEDRKRCTLSKSTKSHALNHFGKLFQLVKIKSPYHINNDVCIKCGSCKDNCNLDAIYVEMKGGQIMGTMTIDGRKVEFTDEKNVLTVIRKAGINMIR